jgi:hypothetical protein
MIQAIEATGMISPNGSLILDQPLQAPPTPQSVRVIILVTETTTAPQTLTTTPPIWEQLTQIATQAPDEEWQKLPTDLAMNFDQYQTQSPQP